MYAKDLLLRVFDADVVEGATYDDCVLLLDGAIRLGVAMDDDLSGEIITWLLDSYGLVGWPETPRVGQLVNGYDGWYGTVLYPEIVTLRQDAHVIELPAHTKEVAVSAFTGDKQFVQCEKHESPEGVVIPAVAPEEAQAVVEAAVIDNIAALGREGLTAKTVRQLKAMCRLLSVRIGGRKAEIVARLALLASIEEVPEPEVVGDATKYPVGIAELLPALQHVTSDGRWYLKDYRIAFRLEVDGRILEWSQKGIVPRKWQGFAGTAMLVPAVVAPVASAS